MNRLLIILTLSFAILGANSIKLNSPLSQLDNYKYKTPQGRQMKIPKKTALIIIAFGKDTGALVNDYLKTKNKYYLQKNRAIYIADIHKMPSIITKMFALPKLKKHKHLIYLHYENKFERYIPNKEGKITLLHIENQKIKNISFISTEAELESSLEK